MKKELLTLETFKVYTEGQTASLARTEKKQDEIVEEQKHTRAAVVKLTEILAKMQAMETIYNDHIRASDKNFDALFKTVRSREGYFKFAGYVRAAIVLVLAGGLGAYGQDYYKRHFVTIKTQEETTKVKPITKDLIK